MPFVLLKHFLSSRNAICAWYLFWNFLPGVHYKENYKAPRKSGRVRSWPEDEPFWMALWACDILTGGTCFGIFRCPESAWKLEAWIDHLHVCTLCLICFFFWKSFSVETSFYSLSWKGFHVFNMKNLVFFGYMIHADAMLCSWAQLSPVVLTYSH